jgi:hypothetical protein
MSFANGFGNPVLPVAYPSILSGGGGGGGSTNSVENKGRENGDLATVAS